MIKTLGLCAVISFASASSAFSNICDYRFSQLIGTTATAVGTVAAGGIGLSAGKGVMAVGGLYFFPNATTGALMLGSTLAGASGAGTIGIIGGSAFSASVLAVLTAPITVVAAAGTAITVTGVEFTCFLLDERITEEDEVLALLRLVTLTANEELFKLFDVSDEEAAETGTVSRVRVPDKKGVFQFYEVRNLYIVNGELMHRDWFLNTSLGHIAAAIVEDS